ncbi:phospholipase A2 [Micromonospora sp. NPDC023888]|uniref:phospholipase A2 n=1 Tax=Micromonospora sp. NPDC023888 TaxID=3155607 RepID=UPI0033DD6ED8
MASLALVLTVAVPARAVPSVAPMSAAAANAMWTAYGNSGGRHWTGGDRTVSVALPDGRVAWLFSDTYLGTVNADGSRPPSAMVHNALVVQDESGLVETRYGGTPTEPKSFMCDDSVGLGCWVADAIVDGSTVRVLVNNYESVGPGALDVRPTGTALVTLSLPALSVQGVQQLPLGSSTTWGQELVNEGGFTYIYGSEHAQDMKFVHLARVPEGGLAGQWQFWTGSGWSSRESDSTRIASGVGTAFAVHKVDGRYLLVTVEGHLPFNSAVVAYTASALTGPFGGPIELARAPEANDSRPIMVYDADVHQEMARDGKLLISYNVNSLDVQDNLRDSSIYRPRFIEVDWPRPQPDPSQLPSAPGNLAAVANQEGGIRLSWTAPPGSNLKYWVYQKDTTVGQMQWVRLPQSTTQSSIDLAGLRNQHQYQYQVRAENAVGEGSASAVASATVSVPPPAVPGNLTATAGTAGDVALSWGAVDLAWYYEVEKRNVTAGDAEFSPVVHPNGSKTNLTVEHLVNGHVYEFRVRAVGGAGSGAPSSVVRATAVYAAPGAPSGLTAVAQGDGAIKLSWTASAGQVWYRVYQRDVTAAEAQFTAWPLPVAEGTTALAQYLDQGHEYEFKVVATNLGGESPPSNVARATSSYATPNAPSGLTAVAQGDGAIKLSWTASAGQVWYRVYQRDVTAAEAQFTAWPLPVAEGTTAVAQYLTHGHEYEFKVSATNQAGESPASGLARATSSYPVPAAPSGLSATAQSDGTIKLAWTPPAGSVWHEIYQRDVTAGEQEFTAWPYPVTEGSSATADYLAHGHEYEFKVVATNYAGKSTASNTVRATATFKLPQGPSGLTATAGDAQATLNWTAGEPNVWHKVYQRDVTAGETTFTAWPYPVTTGTSATATLLVNGHEYEFKVVATNQAGEGPASNTVRVTPVPAKPTITNNLTATARADGTIGLSWQAPGPNVWFVVYQRDVTAGESTFSKWPLPVAEGTSAVAQYLVNGHVYEFKVAATNAAGEGPSSAAARATARVAPPAAPTNLRGSTAGDGKIGLTWDAPAAGAYSAIYWRDVTAGQTTFTRVEYLTAETSIIMEYLQHAHVYEYKVAGLTAGGEGPASTSIQVTARYSVPAPPTNLTATAGNGRATLAWTASPTANVQYVVFYRDATSGQSWQRLPYPTSATSQAMEYLTNGHTYQFRVTASNAGVESAPTATASAKPMPPAPQPPSGLTATAGDGKVSLRWTSSATANVWYWIEMRDVSAGQAWTRLKDPVDATAMPINYLNNGHTYEFRVRSNNLTGDSSPSNVVTAKPMPPVPQSPTSLEAVAGDGKVTLYWGASNTANVWYLVEYRPAGGAWQRLPYPVTTCCTFTQTLLTNGTTYEFRVRATNLAGESGSTNVASARPMPPFPSNASGLTATAGDAKVNLKWTASATSGAQYYIEFRSNGGGWQRLPYSAGCCSFTLNLLTNGATYDFRVLATNVTGTASGSNVASARPMAPLPNAPTNLSVNAWVTDGGMYSWVGLSWSRVSNTPVWYEVHYRNLTAAGAWTKLYSGTDLFHNTIRLKGGDRYDLRVVALNFTGQTSSAVVGVVPKRHKPDQYNYFTQADTGSYGEFHRANANPGPEMPYGFDWEDNGCSKPKWLPDTKYGDAFFYEACQRHDFGYRNHSTWGNKENIDNTFHFDMNYLCGQRAPLDRSKCESDASTYYYGVAAFGWVAW